MPKATAAVDTAREEVEEPDHITANSAGSEWVLDDRPRDRVGYRGTRGRIKSMARSRASTAAEGKHVGRP